MIEGYARSVGELLAEVDRISREWAPSASDPEEIWFRGQSACHHQLLPALYRSNLARFHYDECNLFERFKVFAAPHVQRNVSTEWDWYFLARHHGLPSRLLDWSESLLVAAYFALNEHISGLSRLEVDSELDQPRGDPTFDNDCPVVWMLDAGTLNKRTCGEDVVFVPGGPSTKDYLPDSLTKSVASGSSLPIAILPPRTNPRIAAQHGVFTLHGSDRTPLENLADRSVDDPLRVAKIVMDRNGVCHLWHELQVLARIIHE